MNMVAARQWCDAGGNLAKVGAMMLLFDLWRGDALSTFFMCITIFVLIGEVGNAREKIGGGK